ncbi:MAG TPA: sigma factor [Burkholderiaceae bacterium]|nr:sigma factor [Burkholderiaceae bacterium]
MKPTCSLLDHHAALAGCMRGELWALRAIVEAEGGALNAMVLRIVGDEAGARKVLKEALLQVFREAERFDPRNGTARGWIFAVVRQRALAARRTLEVERRLAASRSAAAAAAAASAEPSAAADGQPDPISLAFFDGYNREQIAGRCHAPAAAVRQWIRGGLTKLMDLPA